jgi:hypothetical protein
MKKFNKTLGLLGFGLLIGILGLFSWIHPNPGDQGPVVELDCPIGQQPLPAMVARNLSTDALRRYACVDPNGVIAFNQILSTSANRAQSGTIRLASPDTIAWRNFVNSGENTISKNASEELGWTAGIQGSYFRTNAANPSQSGTFRMQNPDFIGWRNNANTGDVPLGKNPSDQLTFGGLLLTPIVYSTPSPSTNAPIALTTMATAGASGNSYGFSYYIDQTALGIGCTGNTTIPITLAWTDPNVSVATQLTLNTVTIITNGAVGSINSSVIAIAFTVRAKAFTPVQSSVGYTLGTGCTTGPSYQIYPILELLN